VNDSEFITGQNVALQTGRELVFCCRGSRDRNGAAIQQNALFCSIVQSINQSIRDF